MFKNPLLFIYKYVGHNFKKMTQIKFFIENLNRMLGKYKIRILLIWLSRVFWGIIIYRLERSLYLLFPKVYGIIRVPFIPVFNLIQMYSNLDIHYKADIKGGLLILHPSVGIVISGQAKIGKNLTLTGGNVIGAKRKTKKVSLKLVIIAALVQMLL